MLWYFVCIHAEPSTEFSAQHTLDVCCASFVDYLVGHGVAEVLFDAASDMHLPLRYAGTEVFICLAADIIVAVIEKMRREYCRGVRLGGLPFFSSIGLC